MNSETVLHTCMYMCSPTGRAVDGCILKYSLISADGDQREADFKIREPSTALRVGLMVMHHRDKMWWIFKVQANCLQLSNQQRMTLNSYQLNNGSPRVNTASTPAASRSVLCRCHDLCIMFCRARANRPSEVHWVANRLICLRTYRKCIRFPVLYAQELHQVRLPKLSTTLSFHPSSWLFWLWLLVTRIRTTLRL